MFDVDWFFTKTENSENSPQTHELEGAESA